MMVTMMMVTFAFLPRSWSQGGSWLGSPIALLPGLRISATITDHDDDDDDVDDDADDDDDDDDDDDEDDDYTYN